MSGVDQFVYTFWPLALIGASIIFQKEDKINWEEMREFYKSERGREAGE